MYDRVMGTKTATGESAANLHHPSEMMRSNRRANPVSASVEERKASMDSHNEPSIMNGGTLIHNPTINQQIRNRHIVRDERGQAISKVYKQAFVPVSKSLSKQAIKNDAFTMHENSFDLSHKKEIEDRIDSKSRILHGEFRTSAAFDNSMGPDWTKKTH